MQWTVFTLICWFALFPAPGFAYYCTKGNYIPPEVAYAHSLKEQVVLPNAINLNTASLAELRNLPGMSESLGLKLLRLRPLRSPQDLYRLPLEEPKTIERLIQSIQGFSTF